MSVNLSRKGGENRLARFQTRLAELLDKQTQHLPPHVRFSWRSLSEATDIAVQTLQAWYNASVGSEQYLRRIESDVVGKLMAYFNVSMEDLVVVVQDQDEDEGDSPQLNQETATAASVAA